MWWCPARFMFGAGLQVTVSPPPGWHVYLADHEASNKVHTNSEWSPNFLANKYNIHLYFCKLLWNMSMRTWGYNLRLWLWAAWCCSTIDWGTWPVRAVLSPARHGSTARTPSTVMLLLNTDGSCSVHQQTLIFISVLGRKISNFLSECSTAITFPLFVWHKSSVDVVL